MPQISVTNAPLPGSALTSLIEEAKDYATASRASSTVRQYASNWQGFTAFCASHGLAALPTTPATVCVYLTSLAKSGRAVSTITAHLAAIKYFHDQNRATVNWDDPALSQVVDGIRRSASRPVQKAEAILADDLRKLVAAASGSAAKRDRAILLIGFAGAFRRSEITAITVENIEFAEQGVVVRLARSKTDQTGRGHDVAIPHARDAELCPVRALRDWIEAANLTTGPVFRSVSRSGAVGTEALSEEALRLILAKATERAGLDGKISPHSLRAGFCTQAALNGKDMARIANHARHASIQTTLGYVRVAEQWKNHAGDGLL